ncbi:MAG: hypothetical protein PHR77_03265 [Kiritimatiellae bacterium]|nr:hypothetical protein [Kiritimatiellia bacterium]MDD5519577.1 hypothetical protein [Kiritimatiellia bacterium]
MNIILSEACVAELARMTGQFSFLSQVTRENKDFDTFRAVLPALNAAMVFLKYGDLPDDINEIEFSRLASQIEVEYGTRTQHMFYFWYNYQRLLSTINGGINKGLMSDGMIAEILTMLRTNAFDLSLPSAITSLLKMLENRLTANQFITADDMRDIRELVLRSLLPWVEKSLGMNEGLRNGSVAGSSFSYSEIYHLAYLAGELLNKVSLSDLIPVTPHDKMRDITSVLELYRKMGVLDKVPQPSSFIGSAFLKAERNKDIFDIMDGKILYNWGVAFLTIRYGTAAAALFRFSYDRTMLEYYISQNCYEKRWVKILEIVKIAVDNLYASTRDLNQEQRVDSLFRIVENPSSSAAKIRSHVKRFLRGVDSWIAPIVHADHTMVSNITFSENLTRVFVNGKEISSHPLRSSQQAIIKHCLALKKKGIDVLDLDEYHLPSASDRLVDVFRSRPNIYRILFESAGKRQYLIKF